MFKRTPKCAHKWEVKGWQRTKLYAGTYRVTTELPTSFQTYITLVCEHCGDVKTEKKNGWFEDPRKSK